MRQADINRINRAAEHLHAAQVLLSNIKDKDMEADDRDRRCIFTGRINDIERGLDCWAQLRKAILTIILLASITCSAQTIAEVRNEIHRQGLPCADIVLAQARLETGNFTSARCQRDRNLFGIKHGGKYARYARWQDSVTDYKRRISARYKGGSYYHFLTRIGYAKDRKYIYKLKKF